MAIRIPWKNVFLAEYAGPIVVMPLMLRRLGALERAAVPCALWVAHFVKRFLETLFVHEFSKSSMPLSNLFKNCAYYYGAAALVGWDLARIGAGAFAAPWLALWAAAESLNLYCHLHLASLRAEGDREVKLPTAWPFRLVSSPNYTFEILAWVFFAAGTRSPAAAAFAAVGAATMGVWSKGKLKRYRRKFKGEPAFTAKYALLPYAW